MKSHLLKLTLSILLATTSMALASYKDAIGYTKLIEEFGAAVPDASGILVAQVEFIRNSTWAPEAKGDLADVSFTYNPSNTGSFSTHAYQVGQYFYGSKSIAPGVNEVYAFRTTAWYGQLDLGMNRPPRQTPWRVENHSWVGSIGGDSMDREIIGRQDYRVIDQNIFISVGLDNNTGSMWPLLGNGYNSVAVGVASGRHNRGGTNLYEAGRMKPDLVAPVQYTSYATPVVAAAATVLIAKTEMDKSLAAAANVPMLKALLMSGATKNAFPNWSNSTTRPLDSIYGAGNVNLYNSYKILVAGQKSVNSADSSSDAGWDWNKTPSPGSSNLYPITIGTTWDGELSAVLSWNADPIPAKNSKGDTIWTQYNYDLANLALRLWKLDDQNRPLQEVTASLSQIDNVQHIYVTDLAAGTYALEVSGSKSGVSYGLSWRAFHHETKAGEEFAPSVVLAPTDVSVPVTTTAVFTVEASGSGTVQYQWRKDGTPLVDDDRISGVNTPVLTITGLNSQDEGAYCVLVTNEYGSDTCAPASLELLPFVPPLVWERVAGGAAKIAASDLLKGVIGSDEGEVELEAVPEVSGKGIEVGADDYWVYYLPPAEFAEEDTFSLSVTDSRNRTGTGVVQVIVTEALWISSNSLLALERVPNTDDIHLRYAGLPSAVYLIETSTDLVNWHPLETVTADPSGVYEFNHPNGYKDNQRFYRTVRQ